MLMHHIIRFALLLAMFIVMMLIGDYIFVTQFNVTGLGMWPGFLFALAISYLFFKEAFFQLLVYLCGIIVAIAALQYLGVDLGFSLEALKDLSLLRGLRDSVMP